MTQEEGNKKLFQAVLSGKVDTVREVLSYGFSNINATVPAPPPKLSLLLFFSSTLSFVSMCRASFFFADLLVPFVSLMALNSLSV